ncbi:MAG: phosphonate ABC transporter ATP-binding protein [Azospirillum sp.]|nr:phosphonate ABC transporter ATP-binding protein [Azospirillum sp.]
MRTAEQPDRSGTRGCAVRVRGLNKTYGSLGARRQVLKSVDLTVERGEMVALIGASGSGKSTLLRHIAGLAIADRESGAVELMGRPLQADGRLMPGTRKLRAEVGMVFQQFNLVGQLSLLANVLLGLLGRVPAWRGSLGLFTRQEKLKALEALARVGIAEYAAQRASTLSGGQQQRAAIARTMVQRASVILADEPIASLDPESARRVMDSLARLNRQSGVTIIVCLHQVDYALRYCARAVAMFDGRIVFDGRSDQLTPAFLREIYGSDSEELCISSGAASLGGLDGLAPAWGAA